MILKDIKLNFINRSSDVNNSQIVLFQKNVATDFDETTIAWKVIENCGLLDNHPFKFPMQFDVSSADSYGNFTPKLVAYNGQSFEMIKDHSGDVLQLSAQPSASNEEVELKNNLASGSIDANIYKDGKLLAAKTDIVPGQKAVFQFQPKLYIGVASQIVEGEVMKSAIIQQINTTINLLGVESADIVLTGGGKGPNASPFIFTLENVNA